ncbi:uncharacterized protein LOC132552665 [Ylistrum balloti]|uniref:uncharacterized protein LOC132552665 n=1 Tax=Ylistrum balloti TaxID=509963 RepID=UPI002905C54A|nr:uncharacterized protein LOC132552665 [Ylistrum balloti]
MAVCNSHDGWGSNVNSYSESGRVRILVWIFSSAERVFAKSLTMSQNQQITYEVDLLQEYSIDDYLVAVDVTVSDGNNSGFRFVAAGNSQTDGTYVFMVNCLNTPSFESAWVLLTAQAGTGSQLTISHTLGEYPVEVDVQIRITDNGEYYIFTGSGSAHRDDDSNTDYGGVVYIYNDVDIRVYAPDGEGMFLAYTTGLVAYTGGSGRTGSTLIGGSYSSAEIKVRVWKLCDIGPPAYSSQWTAISSTLAYHEISHNLNVYPDLVTVQIALDTTDYWSDAQGSAGITDTTSHLNFGGVLFGYDTTRIRLWASSEGYVFSAYDGWGTNDDWRFASGQVRIICWIFPPSEILFQHTLSMGLGLTSTYEIPFSSDLETDDILVSTEITVADGNNPGFRFYGTGNSLTDGSYVPFGGVVYVYTESQILLWRPSDSSGGKMVYHDVIWASGHMNQLSDTAQVTIRIMTASGIVTGACGHGSCVASMDHINVSCTCDVNWTGSDCKTEVPTTTVPPTTTTVPTTTTTAPPTTTTVPPTTTTVPTTTTTVPPTTTTVPPTTSTVPPTTTTVPPTTTTVPPTTSTVPPTTTTAQPTTTTVPSTTTTALPPTTSTAPPTTTTVPLTTTTALPPTTSTAPPTTTTVPLTTTTALPPTTTTPTTASPVTNSVMCGTPSTVVNTHLLYSGTTSGSTALYSCITGYTLSSGDAIHTCTAGVWVGSLPDCKACPNPYTPVITTQEALNNRLDELKKNTEVPVKNTTSYKRSLVCANDPRPSSLYVATVGIIILGFVCIFPLLVDGINFYSHFFEHNDNNAWLFDQDQRSADESLQVPQTQTNNFVRHSSPIRHVYQPCSVHPVTS